MASDTDNIIAPITYDKNLWGPVVKVLVGAEKVEVNVHEAVLGASSVFLRNAIKPEWAARRNDPNTIDLSHVNADTFKTYVQWLYCNTLPFHIPSEAVPYVMGGNAAMRNLRSTYVHLAKAYVLGEELMDVKYKNSVLELFVEVAKNSTWYLVGEAVEIIYAGTPPSSLARRLLVSHCVYGSKGGGSWKEEFDKCPPEYFKDCTMALVKQRETPPARAWETVVADCHEEPQDT